MVTKNQLLTAMWAYAGLFEYGPAHHLAVGTKAQVWQTHGAQGVVLVRCRYFLEKLRLYYFI